MKHLTGLAIPREAIPGFDRCLAVPLVTESDLKREVIEYLGSVRSQIATHEFIDIALAERIAKSVCAALDGLTPATEPEHRRLLHAAARYFILEPDGESDLESVTGFDDDAGVLNAVLRHIGRSDLLIRIG